MIRAPRRRRRTGVRVHVLERRQRLPIAVERAFAFYADARNLEAITPPWLGFRVDAAPPELRAGALIDYRLRLHGVPLRWRTRIAVWEPPHRFVDVQLRGPYELWEHTHTFAAAGPGAVEIGDRVRYRIPLGALGELAHRLFVRRDLQRIFDYRRAAVAERLR
jgi:ligand-binding SRPBCC domain-containing protein